MQLNLRHIIVFLFCLMIILSEKNANAQILQLGIRNQTDIQNNSIPLHNFYIGPSVEVMIPIIGFGVSTSAMFSFKYLANRRQGELDDLYKYIYVPLNFKWKFGPKIFRIVVEAGLYVLLPLGDEIEKEISTTQDINAKIWGMNGCVGAEFLKKYRVSVGFRSNIYNSDIEDYVSRTNSFYLELFYIF